MKHYESNRTNRVVRSFWLFFFLFIFAAFLSLIPLISLFRSIYEQSSLNLLTLRMLSFELIIFHRLRSDFIL